MTDVDVTLGEGESLLDDSDELLYRQIVEWMIQGGNVPTYAFGPQPSDDGRPSYSRSSLVTAQESRDWHNANANSRSTGVWAVSVQEVHAQGVFAVDDSKAPLETREVRAPGHCYIDFRNLKKPVRKTIVARLYLHAMRRKEIPTEGEPPPLGELF